MKTPFGSKLGSVSPLFLDKYSHLLQGTLCGLDRVRLRGTLRHLYQPRVMEAYLNACRVLIKDFGHFARRLTERVKDQAYALAEQKQRPFRFLNSNQFSKEDVARQIKKQDNVAQGLICVLSAVEPCMSYNVRGQRETKEIHMVLEPRKCTHFYYYYQHPIFGFMHVRVQSWFPFAINICLNGREWLAGQLDAAKIAYHKKDNCFTWIEDFAKAQKLMNKQLQTDWPKLLNALLKETHPLAKEICRPIGQEYYWSASDTEYATDLIFKDPAELQALYPSFVRHAISTFKSPDVMRFLGRWVPLSTGRVSGQFTGEIISDIKNRLEGIRVKHSVNRNSIKMYDKAGQVLRTETLILDPSEFKQFRSPEGKADAKRRWLPMRRGLADMERRCQVSARANNRYLDALSSVSGGTPLKDLTEKMCRPVRKNKRRHRAINPWSEKDAALLEAISRGEFTINGFRNRDIRAILFPHPTGSEMQKRRAAAVTRKFILLRAHGIISKVAGTHRYVVTARGRQMLTSVLSAREADVEQLTKLAA
jgi:hypothetical protein